MADRSMVLNARHQVASASGRVAHVSAQITRALAWQVGDETSVVSDLEVAISALMTAQRDLHEAVTILRLAAGAKKEGG